MAQYAIPPKVFTNPKDPEYLRRKQAYSDSLSLYNYSIQLKNQHFKDPIYRNLPVVNEEEYRKKQNAAYSQPFYDIDDDAYKKDKQKGKVKPLDSYVYDVNKEPNQDFRGEKTKEYLDVVKLKNGLEKHIEGTIINGVKTPDFYKIYNPNTGTSKNYFYDTNELLSVSSNKIKPISTTLYSGEPHKVPAIASTGIYNPNETEGVLKTKYYNTRIYQNILDEYKKPVQEIKLNNNYGKQQPYPNTTKGEFNRTISSIEQPIENIGQKQVDLSSLTKQEVPTKVNVPKIDTTDWNKPKEQFQGRLTSFTSGGGELVDQYGRRDLSQKEFEQVRSKYGEGNFMYNPKSYEFSKAYKYPIKK